MRFKELLSESEVNKFADSVKNSLGLKQFSLIDTDDHILLYTLMLDKNKQGQGLGSKAMQMLCDYADEHGRRIVLTPGVKSDISGTTSRNRLVKFYKRFGFKENKGKSIDFAMGAGKMFRDPQVKEVKMDAKDGLGSVPDNQNVEYAGLRVMMKPSVFLKLARPITHPTSVEHIVKHLQDGGALGPPFLGVEIPEKWFDGDFTLAAQIRGHEGRNRMLAIQKVEGDDPVEVHLFPRGGLRARHLTPEMVKEMNKWMRNEDGSKLIAGPIFEVSKSLTEAPLPSDWDENVFVYPEKDRELERNSPLEKMIQYAKERSKEYLGKGWSRTVHSVPVDGKDTALKIAHDRTGLIQNAEEIKLLSDPSINGLGITIPLIDYDKKNARPVWVQTLRTAPFNSDKFKNDYGMDLVDLVKDLRKLGLLNTKKSITDIPDYVYPVEKKQRALDLLDRLDSLEKQDVDLIDLEMKANWGMIDGVPVIIDLGVSHSSAKKLGLSEAPLPSDWDPKEFDYNPEIEKPEYPVHKREPFDPIIDYVEKQQAKKLGMGSSRTVHSIDFEGKPTALKIAHNKGGLFQNVEEVRLLQNPEIQALDIVAPLIDYDKEHRLPVWLQTVQMKPKNEEVFSSVYGLNSIESMNLYRDEGYEWATKLIKGMVPPQSDQEKRLSQLTIKQKKRLLSLYEKYKVLEKFGVGIGDLASSNWGIDQTGMPKIVDLGYSDNYTRAYNSGQYKEPEYMSENKEFQIGININDEVKKFGKWACEVLHIQKRPKIILSYDTQEAQENHHTGRHVDGENSIWVYANRNLVDILRTVFHELVHVRQGELGMIKAGSSYPGSPVEVMADAMAGKYIKIYGEKNHHIFQ